jgi:hypothetical protein
VNSTWRDDNKKKCRAKYSCAWSFLFREWTFCHRIIYWFHYSSVFKPRHWAQLVNEVHQRTDCLGEPEFDSWIEQFLVRLDLPHGRTPEYYGPFPLGTWGISPKNKKSSFKVDSLLCMLFFFVILLLQWNIFSSFICFPSSWFIDFWLSQNCIWRFWKGCDLRFNRGYEFARVLWYLVCISHD